MKLRWILFDLGGVLYEIDLVRPVEMLKSLSRTKMDGFLEDYLYSKHRDFMKGIYTKEEFFKEIKNSLNLNISLKEIEHIWGKIIVGFRNEFRPLLTTLKLDYKLALLSNTDPCHIEKILKEFPEFPYFFDKIFLSYEMKMIKPDQGLFMKVLEEIEEEPYHCLFLDDSSENIEIARSMGFYAEQVNNYYDVLNVLRNYEIKVS